MLEAPPSATALPQAGGLTPPPALVSQLSAVLAERSASAPKSPLWAAGDAVAPPVACAACSGTLVVGQNVVKCAECGVAYHVKCLTRSQASRFKGRSWVCNSCLHLPQEEEEHAPSAPPLADISVRKPQLTRAPITPLGNGGSAVQPLPKPTSLRHSTSFTMPSHLTSSQLRSALAAAGVSAPADTPRAELLKLHAEHGCEPTPAGLQTEATAGTVTKDEPPATSGESDQSENPAENWVRQVSLFFDQILSPPQSPRAQPAHESGPPTPGLSHSKSAPALSTRRTLAMLGAPKGELQRELSGAELLLAMRSKLRKTETAPNPHDGQTPLPSAQGPT
jgi:predicted RNA-binding Zn-ribbon protein involved in translation (DUF1610 family)